MLTTIASPPAAQTAPYLDVESLMPWARGIARGVCKDAGFPLRGTEAEELEGEAMLALVEFANRFDERRLPEAGDLHAAFRGFAAQQIRKRLQRYAETFKNGGTYRTTSDPAARQIRVAGLPRGEDDGEVLLAADEKPDWWSDEPEPVTCKFEPVLTIVNSRKPVGTS